MSNKTPIQQAIEELSKLRELSRNATQNKRLASERVLAYSLAIEKLKSKLPAERKFAESCFVAGQAHGMDIAAIMIDKSDPCSEDFSTFYKNNYEDGK